MSSAVLRAMRATCSRVGSIFADASMPMTRRGRSWPAKPAIIPAWVLPVTEHTMIVSKKTPISCSCCWTSYAQLAKPRPPSRWSDAPAGIPYGLPPLARTSSSAWFQLSRKPISKPDGSSRTSAPMMRDSMMLPTRSLTESGQSTQASCTRTAFSPSFAATAATWRVWLDWTPPMETSVSAPSASASGTMYSSLRVLFPPNARPLLTSSRFAQIWGPPRCSLSRGRGWTGLGPNISG